MALISCENPEFAIDSFHDFGSDISARLHLIEEDGVFHDGYFGITRTENGQQETLFVRVSEDKANILCGAAGVKLLLTDLAR